MGTVEKPRALTQDTGELQVVEDTGEPMVSSQNSLKVTDSAS